MNTEETTATKKYSQNDVSKEFERHIKSYLDKFAEEDDSFAFHYNKEDRSIEDCCKFIVGKVKDMAKGSGSIGLDDEDVYGLAKLYYTCEDVGNIQSVQCKIVVNHPVELTPEEKEAARRKAFEELVEENKKKMSTPTKKVKKEEEHSQMSLFD